MRSASELCQLRMESVMKNAEATITKPESIETLFSDTFQVILQSQRTAGFEWQPKFDDGQFILVEHRTKLPKKSGFGGAAQEIFCFRPLKRGHHGVRFDLIRPWEPTPIEQRAYEVNVI
jgi:predicted secreted protein